MTRRKRLLVASVSGIGLALGCALAGITLRQVVVIAVCDFVFMALGGLAAMCGEES